IRLFMNWGFGSIKVADAAGVAKRNPDAKIVIDNINYSEFTAACGLASECGNVYVGTASETMFEGIEYLAKKIGSRRLIGGTAAPLQIPSCGIVKIEKAGINEAEKREILGYNAMKLLGIN
ncbi:MAG: amidohydrolase family protein, partial [Defluviitaleaceae bacterium]|nr:amidohydrolase family protein [Defluviitaleaceae bacterium]